MRELKTSRTALGLYGTILVLPTLVFGWMYWRELHREYEAELASVPEDASDGARRIANAMRGQLEKLLEFESGRPFADYAEYVLPEQPFSDDPQPQRSPVASKDLPTGVLAYFKFNRQDGPDGEVEVFVGTDTYKRKGVAENFIPIVEDYRQRKEEDYVLTSLRDNGTPQAEPLAKVALYMGSNNLACVKACSESMNESTIVVSVSDFRLQFYLDDNNIPRAIASRRVYSTIGPLEDLQADAECLEPLVKGFHLQQGFLIDVNWLFQELPFRIEDQALNAHESLHRPEPGGPIDTPGSVFAALYPVQELDFETFRRGDSTYGPLQVRINTDEIKASFEKQARNLFAVALMLVLTLATGMTLLYRSVNRELANAQRMQNFVAAVTHELRTPVSTIRLHGEMLLDGWASEEEKRQEYYARIVRETKRLSTLVENVLSKSRLTEDPVEPQAADLNASIERLRDDLRGGSENEDLVFDLAPRLPNVWMTVDGLTGILSNLVENARKYAPVENGSEPIRIATRWDGERVLLEVSDRGPGVPRAERDHIFEAFYRVGSEATRTTTGTGLGLHLVQLHAEASNALASVHTRDGGGSIFRIAWRAVS